MINVSRKIHNVTLLAFLNEVTYQAPEILVQAIFPNQNTKNDYNTVMALKSKFQQIVDHVSLLKSPICNKARNRDNSRVH